MGNIDFKTKSYKSFDNMNEKKGKNDDEVMDLVFVLDKSGSMYDVEEDTIGGFNSFINRERIKNPNTLVTLVLFDTEYKVLYVRKPICEVEYLTSDVYYASGCTALLDAIGNTINKLDKCTNNKVLFVITTDGLENSSREFSLSNIKNMIKNHTWEFIFIGADIDSIAEASNLGIRSSHAATYEKCSRGLGNLFRSVSVATETVSNNRSLDNAEWKKDLE